MKIQHMKLLTIAAAAVSMVTITGIAQAAPQALHVQPLWPKVAAQQDEHPERFATGVPVDFSSQAYGEWTTDGDAAVWTLVVTIDGATTASFAARNVVLPQDTTLTIAGSDGVTHAMNSEWVQAGRLWSAIVPGNTFTLVARMPADGAGAFRMDLYEVQAGFRAPNEAPVVSAKFSAADKLADDAVQPKAVGDVIPYTCKQAGGDRSVAKVIVGNLAQCTGTLINSSSGLVKPYLITAGHCDGGDVEPSADRLREISPSIRTTFHYVSSCASLSQGVSQDEERAGAVYRGSGQDLWMVELTHGVPANTVFEAFDARNRVPVEGGYTVHHGSGKPQQYIETTDYQAYGTASGVAYPGVFWGGITVDGSGTGGASGSSLRVGEQHAAIGTAFNVESYSPLFYAWDSVGEFLGPQMTSTAVDGDSLPAPTMTLTVSNPTPQPGETITLTWNSQNAFTCGQTGLSWTDSIETSGPATAIAPTSGSRIFSMTCYGAGKFDNKSVTVTVAGSGGSAGGSTDDGKGGGGPMGVVTLLIFGLASTIRRNPISAANLLVGIGVPQIRGHLIRRRANV